MRAEVTPTSQDRSERTKWSKTTVCGAWPESMNHALCVERCGGLTKAERSPHTVVFDHFVISERSWDVGVTSARIL